MTKARPVIPGETILSTRRVHKRQLLLKPDDDVNQAIEYIVAVYAERYGIEVHALCALGNHKHDASTDPNGAIVAFQRETHQLITRCLNARHGDVESMWSSKAPNRVTCEEPDDIIDKIAYTLANPVSSYLVRDPGKWPGVHGAWPDPPRVVKRPAWFFRSEEDGGKMPASATLRFARPPGFEHLTDAELADKIAAATDAKVQKAHADALRDNVRFVGIRAIRRTSRYAYAKSREPRGGIQPRVAAKRKQVRIERLQANRAWQDRYDPALARYRAGDHDVEFPHGTYQMRVLFNVRCRPPPTG